jgi:hypothetical protein
MLGTYAVINNTTKARKELARSAPLSTQDSASRPIVNNKVYITVPQLSIAFYVPDTFTKRESSCADTAAALGALVRTNGQYPVNQANAAQEYGILVKQYTNFYIVAAYQHTACAPHDPSTNSYARNERVLFLNAVHATIQELHK